MFKVIQSFKILSYIELKTSGSVTFLHFLSNDQDRGKGYKEKLPVMARGENINRNQTRKETHSNLGLGLVTLDCVSTRITLN